MNREGYTRGIRYIYREGYTRSRIYTWRKTLSEGDIYGGGQMGEDTYRGAHMQLGTHGVRHIRRVTHTEDTHRGGYIELDIYGGGHT